MRPVRAPRPLRLKRALLALLFAALATQLSGASAAARVGTPPAMRHLSAATVALPEVRVLLAWLPGALSRPQGPGSWALPLAGLMAICVIGGRRMPRLRRRALHPRRLRR
jgi:hypothetical protein